MKRDSFYFPQPVTHPRDGRRRRRRRRRSTVVGTKIGRQEEEGGKERAFAQLYSAPFFHISTLIR